MSVRFLATGAILALVSACSSAPRASDAVRTADPTELAKRASRSGYHVEVVDSNRRYCRSITPINSHIPHKECVSESSMIDELASEEDANSQRAMLPHGNCAQKTSC